MSKSTLAQRLLKNSKLGKGVANKITESKIYTESDNIPIEYPIMNVAFTGSFDEGFLDKDITVFAGPSKHGKTFLTLLCAKAFLDKYPEGLIMFYDTEYGAPQHYMEGLGIDLDRVIHNPIKNLEELKFDMVNQMENLEEGDKVLFLWDSLTNTPSKKELEDTLNEKAVADMTRAKESKALFRMITPLVAQKNCPLFVIAHTYETLEMFSKQVVSGGKGVYYVGSNIFIMGRQQIKTGNEVTGWKFIINAEKSRYIKEKSRFELEVDENDGINKYSGLMDLGLEFGFTTQPTRGWYSKVNVETGEVEDKRYRLKDTMTDEFWGDIIANEKFRKMVYDKYRFKGGSQKTPEEEIQEELEEE